MKRTVLVFAFLLCGCSAFPTGSYFNPPPVDANSDGVLDQNFVAWVDSQKNLVSGVTGGIFDTILYGISLLVIGGAGTYVGVRKKLKAGQAQVVKQ